MQNEPTPDLSLRPALEALAEKDPHVAEAYEVCGLPPVRRSEPGFAGVVRAIIAQQVSAGAARAIVGRLNEALPEITPERFLALSETELRGIGFSRQKALYARALAEDVLSGRVDFDAMAEMDDEAAIAHFTQAKGIGRWTAEIYLLFALGRPDVFPAGDLALRVAMAKMKRMRKQPDEKKAAQVAKRWRPHRGAAARFLWHYYRHPGVPD